MSELVAALLSPSGQRGSESERVASVGAGERSEPECGRGAALQERCVPHRPCSSLPLDARVKERPEQFKKQTFGPSTPVNAPKLPGSYPVHPAGAVPQASLAASLAALRPARSFFWLAAQSALDFARQASCAATAALR